MLKINKNGDFVWEMAVYTGGTCILGGELLTRDRKLPCRVDRAVRRNQMCNFWVGGSPSVQECQQLTLCTALRKSQFVHEIFVALKSKYQ